MFKRFFSIMGIGLAAVLMVSACSGDPSKGPTYPLVGTVNQEQMKKAADSARLTYFGLLNLAAEYASLPRCGTAAGASGFCSSQNIVNEMRRYADGAGTATKGAQEIADNPSKSAIPVANAVADAQRAVELFRTSVAKVKPAEAAQVGK